MSCKHHYVVSAWRVINGITTAVRYTCSNCLGTTDGQAETKSVASANTRALRQRARAETVESMAGDSTTD